MGRHDPVAAERREVDAVVERLAVDDPRAPRRRAERQREPSRAAAASGSRSGCDGRRGDRALAVAGVGGPSIGADRGAAGGDGRSAGRPGVDAAAVAVGSASAIAPAAWSIGRRRPRRPVRRRRRRRRRSRSRPPASRPRGTARHAEDDGRRAGARRRDRRRRCGGTGDVYHRAVRRKRRRHASGGHGKWLHHPARMRIVAAYEPPNLLGRVQEEALAALPGGTGPGALDGASDTTNRGLQGTEAPGAAAPRR